MSNCQEYHDNKSDKKLLPVGFDQDFVTFGGGGIIKFSKKWQNRIKLPLFPWIQSDTIFHNMALSTGVKFHVHDWHEHTKDNLSYEIYQ
jgi:predicted peroxiredoxin